MESSENGFVNGQILISYKDFIKKKFGGDGLENMNKVLSFDLMPITEEKDYPASQALECMDYIQNTYGPDMLFQMGRFSLQNIGTKRYFTVFLPPKKLLEKLTESVPKVNNTVKIEVNHLEKGAIVTLSNPNLRDIQCNYWHGMLQGVYDLTKTKGEIDVDLSKMGEKNEAYFTMKW